MAIPKFLEDLLIISKLGDNPGADNGLSSSGLREKFDEAGVKIQKYINDTLIPAITEVGPVGAGYHRAFYNPMYGVDESTGVAYYCDLIANHLGGNVYEFNMSGKLEIGYPSSDTDYAYGFVERVFLDIVNGYLPNGGAYTTTAIISSHMHLWKMDGTYVTDGTGYGRNLQHRKYVENLSFYVPARFYKVDGTSGQWQRSSFVNQIGKDEDNYARAYMQCRIVIKCS